MQRSRYLRTFYDDDGSLVLTAKLPPEAGAIVVQAIEVALALEAAAQRQGSSSNDAATEATLREKVTAEARSREPMALRAAPEGEGPRTAEADATELEKVSAEARMAERAFAEAPEMSEKPWDPIGARRADALARISELFLVNEARNNASAERYRVVVHIDQALLAGTSDPKDPLQLCELEEGPRLAVETARRLACDSHLIGLVESEDGEPLNIGRKTRAIPLPLKRALKARDRGCRFPGFMWRDT